MIVFEIADGSFYTTLMLMYDTFIAPNQVAPQHILEPIGQSYLTQKGFIVKV